MERDLQCVEKITFSVAFTTEKAEVNEIANAIAKKFQGDAVVWFAYPKGTSKTHRCDFNRDTGWQVLGDLGFEGVRQVAIDEDWSALRFHKVEFIKTMTRDKERAMTQQGKAKLAKD